MSQTQLSPPTVPLNSDVQADPTLIPDFMPAEAALDELLEESADAGEELTGEEAGEPVPSADSDDHPDADGTVLEEPIIPADSAALAVAQAAREQLLERIRSARRLPRGLRERLASAMAGVPVSADPTTIPSLPLGEVLAIFEETIPLQSRLDPAAVARANHPGGDSFFAEHPDKLSDEEAARIASEQLAASGFGKRK